MSWITSSVPYAPSLLHRFLWFPFVNRAASFVTRLREDITMADGGDGLEVGGLHQGCAADTWLLRAPSIPMGQGARPRTHPGRSSGSGDTLRQTGGPDHGWRLLPTPCLTARLSVPARDARRTSTSSPRKVLQGIEDGRSYRWIASDLGISKNTVTDIVKRHRQNAL